MLEKLKTKGRYVYALLAGGTVLSVAVWLGITATDVMAGQHQ